MFAAGFLEAWESNTVILDEDGSSEDYFPTWGYADPDAFVERCDRFRARQAEQALLLQEERDAESDAASVFACQVLPDDASETQAPAVVPAPSRVAWGVAYWIKGALILLALCLVGSLLATMAFNPDLTFMEALRLLSGKVGLQW